MTLYKLETEKGKTAGFEPRLFWKSSVVAENFKPILLESLMFFKNIMFLSETAETTHEEFCGQDRNYLARFWDDSIFGSVSQQTTATGTFWRFGV